MLRLTRRHFLKLIGITGLSFSHRAIANNQATKQVIVIGGGFGGATVAKYLRQLDPTIAVTLIEANPRYLTCPASNWVLAGLRPLDSLAQTYQQLQTKYAVKIVHDLVIAIDPTAKQVTTQTGQKLTYDRLVVSPGIDFKWNSIEGYDQAASEILPHAWKQAGAQTALLAKQLADMPNGGTVMITAPDGIFRCPPGPYERASLIAHYLKTNKPNSKLLILDAKESFSKQKLFIQGWKELYGYGTSNSLIEWIPASKDGKVTAVDVKHKTLITEFGTKHQADVINIIPAQQAGQIARTVGLTDKSGWCPVNMRTWESKQHPFIHVIGDASLAGLMPKSAFSANSQAKACTLAIIALFQNKLPAMPKLTNTCYSLVAPHYGISIAMIYGLGQDNDLIEISGAGGTSPVNHNKALEAVYAEAWYNNIVNDVFA